MVQLGVSIRVFPSSLGRCTSEGLQLEFVSNDEFPRQTIEFFLDLA